MQNIPLGAMKYNQCPWCYRGDALYVLNKTRIQSICSLKCGFASYEAVKPEDRIKFYRFLKKVKAQLQKNEEQLKAQYKATISN